MKYSSMVGKTQRGVSKDMKAKSHELLHRAGFIRQISAGRYAFMPLGYRVWQKIMNVIEEEMEAVGSQRMLTPNLHPIEIWQQTNRDAAFGDEMHVLHDHHGSTFALGATAEGIMVELVKSFAPTYKQFPFYMHQFSSKFRDEKRPKGGLLRVREFTMKDAYSFDKTEKELLASYEKFYEAYLKIAKRLDLKVVPVLADSGAIGGDYNHEFLVESEAGEGQALRCNKCEYAAHVDRAEGGFEAFPQDPEMKAVEEYQDEQAVTCEMLAKNMGIELKLTTKTILFKADRGFVAAMVRGDYDVNEAKLKRYLESAALRLATAEEVMELTGCKVGFAGPIGLPKETVIVADLTCKDRVNFEVGGNKTGIHLYNLNYERDMPIPDFADIRGVKAGDICPQCHEGALEQFTGIEWGHCFKLDQFYSKPHRGTFVSQEGKDEVFWMGSYGIGLGRSMATIVETHHDEKGIIWPEEVAPCQVHLVDLGSREPEIRSQAESLYNKLSELGVEVLWDDRDVSPGDKFADADLIGIPVRLVLSTRNKGKVEWKERAKEETELVDASEVINRLKGM